MIKIIVAEQGEGKTKILTKMANDYLATAKGNIVYLDSSKNSNAMYTLKHKVRYINTSEYPLENYHEFFGLLCGVLARDNDITHVFVDGLLKISNVDHVEEVIPLFEKLEILTNKHNFELIIASKGSKDNIPEYFKKFNIIN